ncbi:Gfo/Idh/MocA family protein [Psychroflexus planctonicus]|uniref:Dehydrogenase n=1 Tax=Psychroflexus planctonicus TaxID=1526575 RepID=A0ABQ1SDK1_9FLAO|nr:Gfo/Idh/MocA family oxidoreductase [Psychroflexus planctonicus]GGE24755.1 dehydrogenase [Psychroflexus planctonicus]
MKQLNWGIIGLGKMARIFAEDLVQVETARLYAAASRTIDKATAFATDFNAEKAYSSYEELIEDEKIDVVYIATPHAFHFDLAMQSLRAKKHVLCEKPMCMNVQQTKELIAEAKKQKRFLMEAIWTRFMPTTKKLLELLNENRIGKLISVEADFGFKPKMNLESRLFKKSLGGGSLLDIGIYPVFLSLLCLGKPSKINALARKTTTGVDYSCYMLFDYATEEKAILKSTFENQTPCEAELFGTKGSIKLHSRFHHSEQLEVLDEQRNTVEIFELPYQGNGYIHEIEEVNSCIQQGKTESNLLSHQFSLDLVKILEDVKKQIGLTY